MPEIRIEEFKVAEDNREIFGRIYYPEKQGKCPGVILSHGYNGSHENFEYECEYFARQGYVAYAYDFCGGSNHSRSSGKTTDMTIFSEKEDLRRVINHIRELECVDEKNLFLLGASQGGFVTALVAEDVPELVKGVILYFPAFCIPENWRGRFKSVEEIPETVDLWGMNLGRNFFLEIRDFNSFEHIGSYPGEVLIFQGERDGVVTVNDSERARECYANAELVVLPGEGHGFSSEGNRTAVEKIVAFLERNSNE